MREHQYRGLSAEAVTDTRCSRRATWGAAGGPKFVGCMWNHWTLDYGETGRESTSGFLGRAFERGDRHRQELMFVYEGQEKTFTVAPG